MEDKVYCENCKYGKNLYMFLGHIPDHCDFILGSYDTPREKKPLYAKPDRHNMLNNCVHYEPIKTLWQKIKDIFKGE